MRRKILAPRSPTKTSSHLQPLQHRDVVQLRPQLGQLGVNRVHYGVHLRHRFYCGREEAGAAVVIVSSELLWWNVDGNERPGCNLVAAGLVARTRATVSFVCLL